MIRLLVAFLAFPIAATAEPIAIRSGEHETFTRLVIAIGTGVEWELSEVETGFLIRAIGAEDGFDTSQIFGRIPRTRISSAQQAGPDSLRLELACDCGADAFLWQPGQLVVDIVDGPTSDSEVAVVVPTPLTENDPPLPSDAPVRIPDLLSFGSGLSVGLEIPSALQAEPRSPEISETEAALIEGIARAASQGVLDAAVDDFLPSGEDAPVETISPEPAPIQAAEAPSNGRPGIGVTTVMDRDLALLGDLISSQTEQRCLPASFFEIDQWADERVFHMQVAGLAEALTGEFGEQPREAQEDLTRLYLYFGFGAEARAILSADESMSQSRQVLMEMAGLIDDYDEPETLIATQAECETPAALWAFLAQPRSHPDALRNQIIRDFFRLPQPLRGQLAPRFAQGFVRVGDQEAARHILQASEEGDAVSTHEVQATRAMIFEALGEPEDAISVLEAEANDNARITPDSLIRLIDLALEQGLKPAETDLILADAMRQEYRDRPIARDLALAEARGRIAYGQYRLALALVTGGTDAESIAVLDRTYAHMAQHAEAGVFLEFAYGTIPTGLSAETENAIAQRLIDVGFPERASYFLEGSATREAAAERRYLRAEASLAAGEYVEAIDALIGISDERARQLRARAYAGLGDHRNALSAAGPDSSTDDEVLQFRAEAWERLADEEDEALSTFANVVLSPEATEAAVSLADRRELLSASQESRRAVEGLLMRFEADTAQE